MDLHPACRGGRATRLGSAGSSRCDGHSGATPGSAWPAQPARSPAGEAISPAFHPSRPSHAACLARHGQQTTTGTSLSPFRSTVYVKVNVRSGRSCGSGIPDASVLGSHTWLCIGLRQPAPGDAPAPGHALHVPETHSESRLEAAGRGAGHQPGAWPGALVPGTVLPTSAGQLVAGVFTDVFTRFCKWAPGLRHGCLF